MKKATMKKPLAAVVALALVLALAATLLMPGPASAAVVFTDIADSPIKATIEKWAELGVINGYKNDDDGTYTFKPTNPITRGEYAKLAYELFKYISKANNTFSDLAGYWGEEYVLKANAAGIMNGDPGGTVRPEDYITRQEAFALLSRAFQLTPDEDGLKKFSDGAQVDDWTAGGVKFRAEVGAIAPYVTGTTLRPKEDITRGEFLTTVDAIVGAFYNTAGTFKTDVAKNALVNVTGVKLVGTADKKLKVNGNLYLTQGIGKGDFWLTDGEVTGTMFINGGGEKSIHIIGSIVKEVKAYVDDSTGVLRIVTDAKSDVKMTIVEDGSDEVILEGTFKDIDVSSFSEVTLAKNTVVSGKITVGDDAVLTVGQSVTVDKLVVNGDDVTITTEAKSVIKTLDNKGANLDIEAGKDSTIKNMTTSGDNLKVEGAGRVETVTVTGGKNVTITTPGTTIVNKTPDAVKTSDDGKTTVPGNTTQNAPGTLPVEVKPDPPATTPPPGDDIVIIGPDKKTLTVPGKVTSDKTFEVGDDWSTKTDTDKALSISATTEPTEKVTLSYAWSAKADTGDAVTLTSATGTSYVIGSDDDDPINSAVGADDDADGFAGKLKATGTWTYTVKVTAQWYTDAAKTKTDGDPLTAESSCTVTVNPEGTKAADKFYTDYKTAIWDLTKAQIDVLPNDGAKKDTVTAAQTAWAALGDKAQAVFNATYVTNSTTFGYDSVDAKLAAILARYSVNAQTPTFSPNLSTAEVTYYSDDTTATDLSVTASVADGGTLTYQWYSSTTNSTTGGTQITDATSTKYTPSLTTGTTYYYVVVTNTITDNGDGGNKTAKATSAIAKITVRTTARPKYATVDLVKIPSSTDPKAYLTVRGTGAPDAGLIMCYVDNVWKSVQFGETVSGVAGRSGDIAVAPDWGNRLTSTTKVWVFSGYSDQDDVTDPADGKGDDYDPTTALKGVTVVVWTVEKGSGW